MLTGLRPGIHRRGPTLTATILTLAILTTACGSTAAAPALISEAHQIVTQLAGGDDAAVEARLTAAVQKQLSAAQLAAAWTRATVSLGAYQTRSSAVSGTAAGGTEVVVTATFTHGTLDVRLHFDAQSQVDGLFLQPHPSS